MGMNGCLLSPRLGALQVFTMGLEEGESGMHV